jgi:hypothetical protein
MKTRALLALILASGCASAPPPSSPAAPAPGAASQAPYDSPPAGSDTVTIELDLDAARRILALLSAATFNPDGARALESLPAVKAAIRDSKRPPDAFEHDLAAAFDDKTRVTGFDFRKIREDRARWTQLLAMISGREAELTKLTSDRARALLPADRPVSVTMAIFLTFGLPGRADHIAVPDADGAGWSVVVDLSRALSDVQSSPPAEQIQHLSRLMAAEAYQRAWAEYRAGSPAWRRRDAALGQLEPLLRRVAEAGPVAIYSVDENFFPLAVWLRQPMRDNLDELNRVADRLVSAEGDLDARMGVAAEIQKADFTARVAGPAGAFLADGIIQGLGLDAYRTALAGGPRAFFEAYARASERKASGLIPLGKAIREQLAAAPPPPRP